MLPYSSEEALGPTLQVSDAALAKPGRNEVMVAELVELPKHSHLWFRKNPGGSVEDGWTGAGRDETGVKGSL